MDSNKQIKLGAIISYLAIFINIATGLVYTPWMMNAIGKSDYGLYTLAMSLINTFMIDFGLSMAAQRYVSKYLADKDQRSADNAVGLIYRLYFLITVVIAAVFVVLYFFVDQMYAELTPAEIQTFKSLYIVAAVYSVISFPFIPLTGILKAYEKFVQLKLCDLLSKLVSIGLTVGALIMGLGVYSLVFVHLIAGVAFILVRLYILRKTTPLKPNYAYRDPPLLKRLFSFSVWTSVSSILERFLISLSPSILGIVSGTSEIAVFGYAVSLESYIYTFVTAINGFFMPKLSRISTHSGEQSSQDVLKLMVSVGRFILMLFSLIFIGFLALGQEFIGLLFGSQYDNSYYCTLLICAYGFIAYPQQIAATYVMVKNKVRYRAYISMATFAVNLALSFVLGKLLGAIGVSVSICITLLLNTIALNVLYKKALDIDILSFFRQCHLRLLPGILLYAAAAFGIRLIPSAGFVGFGLKVLGVVAVFLVILWCLMLSPGEKKLLKKGR